MKNVFYPMEMTTNPLSSRSKIQTRQDGFTLVEIMVAVSIFVIVAFIVTTTLLTIIDASRRANVMRAVMDNVNFAVDSMAFKLKFGREYRLNYTSGNGDRIDFVDRNGNSFSYCQGTLDTYGAKQTIYFCKDLLEDTICTAGTIGCRPITSADIDVLDMQFRIVDTCGTTICPEKKNEQIVISIKAEAYLKRATTSVDFQTSVTQAQSQEN